MLIDLFPLNSVTFPIIVTRHPCSILLVGNSESSSLCHNIHLIQPVPSSTSKIKQENLKHNNYKNYYYSTFLIQGFY